jgi:hypothetical protein
MSTNLPIAVVTTELMRRTIESDAIALPFARNIFLLETHIAGLAHYQLDDVEDQILPGVKLTLRREPGNSHDELAIEILLRDGYKLGYVPMPRNPVLARLMDAGKALLAEVVQVGEWHGNTGVRFKIVMREDYNFIESGGENDCTNTRIIENWSQTTDDRR